QPARADPARDRGRLSHLPQARRDGSGPDPGDHARADPRVAAVLQPVELHAAAAARRAVGDDGRRSAQPQPLRRRGAGDPAQGRGAALVRSSALGVLALLAACGPRSAPPDEVGSPATVVEPPGQVMPATGSQMIVELGEAELIVALSLDSDRVMVSEPSYAELTFRGSPGVEVEMAWMGRKARGRPSNYALAFVDGSGATLAVPEVGPEFGGQSWIAEVGEEPGRQRLFLPNWVVELRPGKYTVTARTTVRARGNASADWQEVEVSLAIPIEVTTDDDAALGALIETIAAAA